jgi:hypothetical protein
MPSNELFEVNVELGRVDRCLFAVLALRSARS